MAKKAKRKSVSSSKNTTSQIEVQRPWKRPMAMVVYGGSGIGKTSFAACFPNTLFVIDPTEDGILDLEAASLSPSPTETLIVEDFNELVNVGDMAQEYKDRGIETVIYDSATGFQGQCFDWHCAEYFDDDWSKKGFYSYYAGPKNAAQIDWPRYLKSMNQFTKIGIDVILIAHSQIKNFNNPATDSYDKFTPTLDKEIWQQTHRWAKIVLYYEQQVETTKEGPKAKADVESIDRVFYTGTSPIYDAKNRHNLPPIIQAGDSGQEAYDNFIDAFPK